MISFLWKLLKDGMKTHWNSHLYILRQRGRRTELGGNERKLFDIQISTLKEPRVAKEEVKFEM